MKMAKLRCPSCNATLEVDDDRKICFCTYCGEKIVVDDFLTDKEIKFEMFKMKKDTIAGIACILFAMFAFIGIIIMSFNGLDGDNILMLGVFVFMIAVIGGGIINNSGLKDDQEKGNK